MQKNGCNGNVNIDVHARQGGPPKDLPGLRPYSHESGDFCIRKFFYADTKISVSTRTVYESYTTVHTYPDTQRIQKFPLWRAYTEILGYTERIRRTRVDAMCIRIKKKLRIQKSPDTCGRGLNRVELSVICSLINLKWI